MKEDVNKIWDLIGELNHEDKKIIYKKMLGETTSSFIELMGKASDRADAERFFY